MRAEPPTNPQRSEANQRGIKRPSGVARRLCCSVAQHSAGLHANLDDKDHQLRLAQNKDPSFVPMNLMGVGFALGEQEAGMRADSFPPLRHKNWPHGELGDEKTGRTAGLSASADSFGERTSSGFPSASKDTG